MNTSFRKYLIGALVLVVALGIAAGYKLVQLNKVPEEKEVVGYPVATVLAEQRSISAGIDYVGTVEAWEEVDLAPKISGRIINIFGREGDVLKKGQLAVSLEGDELKGRANTLEKKVQAAKSNADYWASQVELYNNLYKEGVISEQDFRKVVLNRDNAINGYEEARAALTEARIAQENSTIAAPITGTIISTYSYPGDLAVSGKPVLTMADTSKLKVLVKVVEEDLMKLKKGGSVLLDPGDGKPQYEAKISEIYPAVDRNLRTGTLEIALPREMLKDYSLKPGMSINVRFILGESRETIAIPQNTVLTDEDEANYVFVVEEGKAVKRFVKLGFSNGEFVEVTDGLKKGDRIISTGLVELYDGRSVYLGGEKG